MPKDKQGREARKPKKGAKPVAAPLPVRPAAQPPVQK